MPYYIVACNKEGQDQDKTLDIIERMVVRDRNQVLGRSFPLTNDKVSTFESHTLIQQIPFIAEKIGVQDRLPRPIVRVDGHIPEVRDITGPKLQEERETVPRPQGGA